MSRLKKLLQYFFIDTRFKTQFYPLTDGNTFTHEISSDYIINDFRLYKKKVSSGTKAPLSNRVCIIGLERINNPAADGKEINRENSKERF